MYYINIKGTKPNGAKVSCNYSCIHYNYIKKEGLLDLLELEETINSSKISKLGVITRSIEIDRSRSAVFVMNINGKTLESYHLIPK